MLVLYLMMMLLDWGFSGVMLRGSGMFMRFTYKQSLW